MCFGFWRKKSETFNYYYYLRCWNRYLNPMYYKMLCANFYWFLFHCILSDHFSRAFVQFYFHFGPFRQCHEPWDEKKKKEKLYQLRYDERNWANKLCTLKFPDAVRCGCLLSIVHTYFSIGGCSSLYRLPKKKIEYPDQKRWKFVTFQFEWCWLNSREYFSEILKLINSFELGCLNVYMYQHLHIIGK